MDEKSKQRYLRLADSYWGDCRDGHVEIRRVSIVKTRKPHQCISLEPDSIHSIPVGEIVVRDSAKCDGTMGVCYTCLPCLDAWAKECRYDAA